MSGTYRSAKCIVAFIDTALGRVLDTHTLGAGLGILVKQAINWANAGDTADEIESKIINLASREKIFFIVNTLEYLHKGGRTGVAQKFLGSMLHIKPILQLQNGIIEPAGSQRTKKKIINLLLTLIDDKCPKNSSSHLSIMHREVEAEAKEFALQVSEITGILDTPIYEIPGAILVYSGPGTLGISFFVYQEQ